jgi:hypothetical protein
MPSAQCCYNFKPLRRLAVADDRVDPRADLVHLLVVGVFVGRQHVLRRHLLAWQLHDLAADAA